MTTSFPSGLDALSNPSASDAQSAPSHAGQHADANDAIEALEAKVGVNSSAVATSLDYLAKTAVDPGHTHTTGGAGIPATLLDAKGDLVVASAADTAARLAVGSNDQVLTADSAQSTGVKWATVAPSGTSPQQTFGQKYVGQYGSAVASGTSPSTTGMMGTGISTQGTAFQNLDADGVGVLHRAGSSGAYAAWYGGAICRLDHLPKLMFKFKVDAAVLTSQRIFVGLTAQGLLELQADNNGTANLGLQFSTVRGDTNWQWVKHTGAAQVLTSLGIAPVVGKVYYLQIDVVTTTSIVLTLRDSALASLATVTQTTGLPGTTTNLAWVMGLQDQTAGNRDMYMYFVYIVSGAGSF